MGSAAGWVAKTPGGPSVAGCEGWDGRDGGAPGSPADMSWGAEGGDLVSLTETDPGVEPGDEGASLAVPATASSPIAPPSSLAQPSKRRANEQNRVLATRMVAMSEAPEAEPTIRKIRVAAPQVGALVPGWDGYSEEMRFQRFPKSRWARVHPLAGWARRRERRAFGLVTCAALALASCRRSPSAAECAPCRAPFTLDEQAAQEVRAEWARAQRRLGPRVAKLELSCLCFGDGLSVLTEGQNITLPVAWPRPEQAARAAHLALHRAEPPWTNAPGRPCDDRVRAALQAEADGHALELETRRALGVSTTRYAFEADFFEQPPARRVPFLFRYFVTHPQGDGVVPGFAKEYRARCELER